MPGQAAGAPAGPVTRPPAMDKAVLLMKVGAGFSVLGLVISLLSRSAIRDAIEKSSAKQTTPLTQSQIDTAVTFSVVVAIIVGLIGVGLWLWMASANGKGKSWARIVATVLFGLSVLGFLANLVQAGTLLTKLVGFLGFLVGAAAIFFMYQKESSAFYKAASAPRT
jgi:hypothetical protein